MIGSVELQAKEKDDNVKARQIEQRNRKLVNMFLGKECVNECWHRIIGRV